ncbi:MAG: hypothetical protein HY891_01265 [Deltaproteobacteria bacterium]|nr:hypothetical protein [Deltaproteobacteria bacterium]
MNRRCKYLKIVRNGQDGSKATWNCYKQYEERFLVQSCYLKKGECRYSNGPFPPDSDEAGDRPHDGR